MDNDSHDNELHLLNRRQFLRVSAVSTGMTLLAACGGNTKQANNASTKTTSSQQTPKQLNFQNPPSGMPTPTSSITGKSGGSPIVANATGVTGGGPTASVATEVPQPTLAVPSKFNEPPELSKMVSSGKLPKVEDRLPKSPMVLKPVEKVGTYGGTWHTEIAGGLANANYLFRTIGYEHLVRWVPDTRAFSINEIIPNLAESFEIKANGKEYIFKLRQGVKWSDGQPYTTDDIMFWYQDVVSNKELTPEFPSWLTSGGKPVVVERKDDYTVVFRFEKPSGFFLQAIAGPGGRAMGNRLPAHYMKQFHKKYNPKVVQEAKKANLKGWTDLFTQKAAIYTWENSDKPVLGAWKMTKALGESTQQVIAERNPYYWKVDTEGNQLPYIDRIVYQVNKNHQVTVLKAANGEIDMMDVYDTTLQDKPVLYKNRSKGNYHFIDTIPSSNNTGMIALNLTTRDENKRKVFNDKNFRIGLSYAIDRQAIIDVVYVSQGEPYQGAPRPESSFYNEKLAKQYTEHSVEKANQYLDKVLPKKDSNGIRLGPDGKPFFFQVEVTTDTSSERADVMEQVQHDWQKVGINMRVKSENRDIFYTRKAGNEPDATVWGGAGGLEVMLEPRWYFPANSESNFAIPWATWFNNPKAKGAIEPPPPAQKQMNLYRQIESTADSKEQVKLMKQILEIAQEQFWVIGISLPAKGYDLVKNDFHNVPKTMLNSWTWPSPAPTNPPQYFIEGK